MCGAYIGVDEYKSKLAILTEKFAPDAVSQETKGIAGDENGGRSVWSSYL